MGPREAKEGELEGEFLMFLVSCSTVFIPVRNYSIEFSTKPLLRKNLFCGQRNFKNQTVLGNVIRLKSSLNTCYLASYLRTVAQKYGMAAITFRR